MTLRLIHDDEPARMLPTVRRIEQLLDALPNAHSRRCVMTLVVAGWLDRFPVAERSQMSTLLEDTVVQLDEVFAHSMGNSP